MSRTWKLKAFEDLTVGELYEILRLRAEIFVVEQDCVYQDLDGKDRQSMHLFLQDGEEVIACLRIIPAGISYKEPSIGRFVVKESERKSGLGREAMNQAIEYISSEYKEDHIRISGQAYLREFYESLGFKVVKDPYLEDGIPHFQMLRGRVFK
ncbi:MAG: GNAT family N-acetyltransferase [Pseudobutyrivibrio sp.]|nr:GNAT family N-acetyltransferase [Pseudobutyrivibrio sp.]